MGCDASATLALRNKSKFAPLAWKRGKAMGIQEALFGAGALILLAILVYGVRRSKRPRQAQGTADEATRRNFDRR